MLRVLGGRGGGEHGTGRVTPRGATIGYLAQERDRRAGVADTDLTRAVDRAVGRTEERTGAGRLRHRGMASDAAEVGRVGREARPENDAVGQRIARCDAEGERILIELDGLRGDARCDLTERGKRGEPRGRCEERSAVHALPCYAEALVSWARYCSSYRRWYTSRDGSSSRCSPGGAPAPTTIRFHFDTYPCERGGWG